ncbi:MAG TPA: hypothetical protein VKB51_10720 [bacterium]|nr:hypothetical protein [bacterium]
MPYLRMASRRWASVALAALLVAILAAPALAYIPSLKDIYRLVAARQPAIQRAMLETRTYVFDPLGRSGKGVPSTNPDAMPVELPERSYRQKIYWIRNAFLGIETYAEDGTLLNFYLNEGFRPVMGNLTPGRTFSESDVVHPFLAFVSADPARWRQAVEFWGINPQRVDIARGPKGEVYYRLVESEEKAVWLDPDLLRPVKLQTRLAGGPHGGHLLTIEFSEFMFIGDGPNEFYFPRTVNFLLDGRLFKQTVVMNFDADPSVQGFPITKLRALAAKAQPERPVSFVPQTTGARP